MKTILLRQLLAPVAILSACLAASGARAQQAEATQAPPQQAVSAAPSEPVERDERTAATQEPAAQEPAEQKSGPVRSGRSYDDVVFHLGEDSYLAAGETANAVVSVFGSTHVAGAVREAVVSIFGNSYVSGPVGEATVSIFGNTYIDNTVGDSAVAVFGNLELGPHAQIDGDVVAIGGTITRDPQAVVRGQSEVVLGNIFGDMQWLRAWVEHCLLYARPLAFEPELGWAWSIAGAFLLLYVALGLLFGGSVTKCVDTLEAYPGQSVLAALASVLLTPVVMFLLVISVIGMAIVPFVGLGLFCVGLFGKAVMLAALGRRVTHFTGIGMFGHAAFAVLIGGSIVLGLYTVPVLGFILYKLLGVVGFGVVVYTMLLSLRQRNAAKARSAAPAAAAASATTIPGAAPVADAGDPAPAAAEPATGAATESPVGVAAPVLAGFWIRMAALAIDLVLVGVIANILEPLGEVLLVMMAGYGALMWKLKGTTIGGIVCGLKVVRRDGAELGWDTAIVRALGCFLSLVVAGLGFVWIAFDDERQAWHDKIAGTLVVRTPRTQSLV